jgi:hypothetical protein
MSRAGVRVRVQRQGGRLRVELQPWKAVRTPVVQHTCQVRQALPHSPWTCHLVLSSWEAGWGSVVCGQSQGGSCEPSQGRPSPAVG